jgi:hypothetical protein
MTIQFRQAGQKHSAKVKKVIGLLCIVVVTVVLGFSVSCNRGPTEVAGSIDSGNPKAAAEKVAEADGLYAKREDLDQARQALALLRQARVEDYGSYDIAWKLSRSAYFVGDHTPNEDERDAAFKEGIESGEHAVKLQDGKPEGHFWLGANYGGSAKNSMLSNLSSVEDIRREMSAVLKLDEGFQSGSAYLGLGQLYLQAPRMLGGDKQKAIDYLEKGLKFGKDNALLHLRLAEAYHLVNRDADALKQIEYVLSMKIDPAFTAEYKEAVDKAQKLRGELKTN